MWTYAFHLIRSAAVKYRAALVEDIPSKDLEGDDGIHKSLLVQPVSLISYSLVASCERM